jgi:hypothetical protein
MTMWGMRSMCMNLLIVEMMYPRAKDLRDESPQSEKNAVVHRHEWKQNHLYVPMEAHCCLHQYLGHPCFRPHRQLRNQDPGYPLLGSAKDEAVEHLDESQLSLVVANSQHEATMHHISLVATLHRRSGELVLDKPVPE